ncbi:MAG: hypothetical protein JEY91_03210 [Spirochaetaceae bacterium]|nr:hypothetical protein [Spirochaetaceae bacterium]
MKTKKTIFILISSFILTAAAILVYFLFLIKPSGEIIFYTHLYNSDVKEELSVILDKFDKTNPHINLTYHILPYRDMIREIESPANRGDMSKTSVILSSLVYSDIDDDAYISPGTWTGTEWKLYYNQDIWKQTMGEKDPGSLNSLNFSDFCTEIRDSMKDEQIIFSASSRYYIQWLSWVQHLKLVLSNGRMPSSLELSQWSDAVSLFDSLVEEGYINRDHGEINEASAALKMFRGESLFTLSTDRLYNIFLPGDREKIGSISFPSGKKRQWSVGSGFYLAALKYREKSLNTRKATRLLIDYLRSEQVINSLLVDTGTKLTPPRKKYSKITEIPSIADIPDNEALRELIDYIRK